MATIAPATTPEAAIRSPAGYRSRHDLVPDPAGRLTHPAQPEPGHRAAEREGRPATLAARTKLYSDASVTSDLERLAQLAVAILNRHVNDNGLCGVCGCDFPCESAVLAEHNAALL
jgi:hypothetical protein